MGSKQRRNTAVLVVSFVVCLAGVAPAAPPAVPQNVQAGAVEKTVAKPSTPAKSSALPEIIQPPRPELKIDNGRKIRVEAFKITGNTRISTHRLSALIRRFEKKEMSISDLKQVADVITQHYWEKGFITSFAYVPAQKIEKGEVEIAVIEGRVGTITVQGNKWYSSSYIEKEQSGLKKEEVLNVRTLERGLLLSNDNPKLNVNATLTKGSTPGTSDIVLTAKDKLPMNLDIFFSNYGSRYTGRNRLGLTWDWGNFTKHGDILTLTGILTVPESKQLGYYKAGYVLPINGYGTKVGVTYSYMDYNVGKELEVLDVEGISRVLGATVTHPLIRARDTNLWVNGQLAVKDFKNYLFADDPVARVLSSDDELTVLSLGLSGDRVKKNRFGSAALTTSFGLGGFLGGMGENPPRPSRPGADGKFVKVNLDLSQAYKLGSCQLITRAAGQWASDHLATGEQFIIGGPDTVRGYPTGERMGDHGYFLSAELRTPALPGDAVLNKYVNWAFFVDHGSIYTKDPEPGISDRSTLSGYGAGLRIQTAFKLNVRFDAALPIEGDVPTDGKDVQYWVQGNLEF